MGKDLAIIKKLEERIGLELPRLYLDNFVDFTKGYIIDNDKNVLGLNLSNSSISDISPLKELTNLTSLNLSGNQVSDISALKELIDLTKLDLSANQISDIIALKELRNLTYLDLRYNRISHLPREIVDFNMEIYWKLDYPGKGIFLEGNPLESPPVEIVRKGKAAVKAWSKSLEGNKRALNEVKVLLVGDGGSGKTSLVKRLLKRRFNKNESQTHGININSWKLTPQDKKINININKPESHVIMKNPRDFFQSENILYILLMDGRKGEKIEYWLKHVKNLGGDSTVLVVINKSDQKSLIDVNQSMLMKKYKNLKGFHSVSCTTGEGIETFSQELVKELAVVEPNHLNEVKVLIVGDGGVGKTSLGEQLFKQPFDKNGHQIQVINENEWKLTIKKDKIKINIWDFGGQEIMHATHQFFLSKRCLYILVLDGRKDEKIEYWLKHVKSFGGDSPVLVVINKIDQNPSYDVNRRFLKEKYPNIIDFPRVSCATGDNIKTFTNKLIDELAKVDLISTTWAESWFNVKTQLEQMRKKKKDYIDYNEYKTICQKENITDKTSQDTLVEFLNDLGVVLNFKDFKLKETHVLEPEWVTTAVYRIINSEKIEANKGELKLEKLDEILKKRNRKDYNYPQDKCRYIIELMQKFELCYEIDRETILIPDLLKVQQPNFEFDYASALKFQIDYDFLPRSILPRFIVKMHKDINPTLCWRTGVKLEDKSLGSTAVVKSDNDADKIYIYVQGTEAQKRDYLTILRKTFWDINNSFKKLEVNEKVPMPDAPDITVSYRHLLLLEEKGIPEYIPDGSKKPYKIKELLGAVYGQVGEANEEEILRILRDLKEKSDTTETFLQKATAIFEFEPRLFGVKINMHNLIKKVLNR